MKKIPFNINVDVAEGMGNEALLFASIHSCNIACGAHAGSLNEMKDVIELAKGHQVKIGAHPSYPDRENFGRFSLKMTEQELKETLTIQIDKILNLLDETPLHHVKAHGALYHDVAHDSKLSAVFLNVIKNKCPNAIVYTLPQSYLEKTALELGMPVFREAFLDRRYATATTLLERQHPEAQIKGEKEVCDQFFQLTAHQRAMTVDGEWVEVQADTYCLHGDHPNVLKNLNALQQLF